MPQLNEVLEKVEGLQLLYSSGHLIEPKGAPTSQLPISQGTEYGPTIVHESSGASKMTELVPLRPGEVIDPEMASILEGLGKKFIQLDLQPSELAKFGGRVNLNQARSALRSFSDRLTQSPTARVFARFTEVAISGVIAFGAFSQNIHRN